MKNNFILIFFFVLRTNLFGGTEKIVSQNQPSLEQKMPDVSSLRNSGLAFTPNKGQIADMDGKPCPDVLYKGNGVGSDIYLRKTGISYVQSNMGEVMKSIDEQLEELLRAGVLTESDKDKNKDELTQKVKTKIHRVDMDFEGANTNCRLINEDELEGYTNYYYAHCPQGITNVHQYNKVTYKDIYEGVDIKYYGDKANGIKYDLIVQPHADPNQITINWKGVNELIMKNEKLIIKTSVSEFYESIPKVYQNINGKIVDVECKYKLDVRYEKIDMRNDSKKNTSDISHLKSKIYEVHFELGTYNMELPLIIDPATWITYYGGTSTEYGVAVCVDKQSNVLFTGSTGSLNFPISSGAFQIAFKNSLDAFVVKVDPINGFPIWSTYFGGSGTEYSHSIASDGNNNVLIAGYVQSFASANDLPIATPPGSYYQPFTGGANDGFVAKFAPAGGLIWSTHFGGSGNVTELYDICTDVANNFFIIGRTNSSGGFPILAAYQPVFNGGWTDCCIAKFNSSEVLQWCTYYGGTADDRGWSICCDIPGNVFIAGNTLSIAGFPILSAYQPINQGGGDAFLAKMNSATGAPVWSTYFGGTQLEYCFGVSTDNIGNVIITGSTKSPTGIATPLAFQTVLAGGAASLDTYVAKFDNSGNLLWATYLGGSIGPIGGNAGSEEGYGIAIDNNNNIIVAGDTYSTDFPVTPCAYQTTFKGTEDQYITTFDPSGKLVCSGYLGLGDASSPHNEGGYSMVAVDGCFVYLVGSSFCNYPVTSGAFQTTCSGSGGDAVFSKLYINTCGGITSSLDFTAGTTGICSGQSVSFTSSYTSCELAGIAYLWSFPGGTPATSSSVNPAGITYNTPGIYPVKLVIQLPCGNDSIEKAAYVTVNTCGCTLAGQFTKGTATCTNCGCQEWVLVNGVNGTPPYTYQWPDGYDKRYKNKLCPGNYNVKVTDKNGCSVLLNISSP